VLPYVFLLIATVACYFVMRAVDIPIRDDAIYDAVSHEPLEPRYLRAYLIDPRNTRHRDTVTKKLADFYDPTVAALRNRPGGTSLKDGLAKLLESVGPAGRAIVSIRAAE